MNDDENIFFNLGLLETPRELRERMQHFCGSLQSSSAPDFQPFRHLSGPVKGRNRGV